MPDKVEREKLLLAVMPDLALRILDHVRDRGRVTIGDAVTLTCASLNTLKEHLRMLVEALPSRAARRQPWHLVKPALD